MEKLARPLNSWDALKLLGLGLMFVDHAGAFIFTDAEWMRAVGRAAPPVFFFLAGYAASYRFQIELLVLAVLLALVNYLASGVLELNILFTILFCRLIFDGLERRGKTIARPFEWYIGSVALIASIVLTQYGSIGFLFALYGYMRRRSERYPLRQQYIFCLLAFVTYGLLEGLLAGFGAVETLLMAACLAAVARLLAHIEITPLSTMGWPSQLVQGAKYTARYSAYIYALHLAALVWITGISY